MGREDEVRITPKKAKNRLEMRQLSLSVRKSCLAGWQSVQPARVIRAVTYRRLCRKGCVYIFIFYKRGFKGLSPCGFWSLFCFGNVIFKLSGRTPDRYNKSPCFFKWCIVYKNLLEKYRSKNF